MSKKSIRYPGVVVIRRRLNMRLKQVGMVRDKLRDDISKFEDLKDTCDRAYENLQSAIQALSELA